MREVDALTFAKEQGQKEIVKLLESQRGLSTDVTKQIIMVKTIML